MIQRFLINLFDQEMLAVIETEQLNRLKNKVEKELTALKHREFF